MSNYRITAFDGVDFTQTGMHTKGGTVGDIKARFKMVHPPHGTPIDPYGGASAPIEYKPIKTKILLAGTGTAVNTIWQALRAKVGESGTLTATEASGTTTRTAYMLDIECDWDASLEKNSSKKWLHLTITFQPTTDWA